MTTVRYNAPNVSDLTVYITSDRFSVANNTQTITVCSKCRVGANFFRCTPLIYMLSSGYLLAHSTNAFQRRREIFVHSKQLIVQTCVCSAVSRQNDDTRRYGHKLINILLASTRNADLHLSDLQYTTHYDTNILFDRRRSSSPHATWNVLADSRSMMQ